MKITNWSVLLMVLAITVGCALDDDKVIPSGRVIKRTHELSNFSDVYISDGFKAFVTFSDGEDKVEVEAEKNLHAHFSIYKRGNQLVVKLKDDVFIWGNHTMNIHITTSKANNFNGSGGASFELENTLHSDYADVHLSGGSSFSGRLSVDKLSVDTSGGSELELSGDALHTTIACTGGSQFNDYFFTTEQLDASLSGGSEVFLSVTNQIKVTASGGSTLYYKGTPKNIDKNLSVGSELVNRN